MEDPIKIIHKIKNNNKKIIYKVYIFIGPLVSSNIIKILESIKDLDFYSTFTTLQKTEITQLEIKYGKFWYEKFFLSDHLENQRYHIDETLEKKQFLINNYGEEWYNKHILTNKVFYKNINHSFTTQYYNYMLLFYIFLNIILF